MFLKNRNQVCLDARAAKPVFVPEFDQQRHGQNQNAAIVVQSAQRAKRAMHRRVVVDQSRQPGQIDLAVSLAKHQIPSEHHVRKVLQ
jgi:hypothetical protein